MRLGCRFLQAPFRYSVRAQVQTVIFHRDHVLTTAVQGPTVKPIAGTTVEDRIGTTRHARRCTTCASVNVTHRAAAAEIDGGLGQRSTATSWGSSGRRFKSCQPDQGKWRLSCCDV